METGWLDDDADVSDELDAALRAEFARTLRSEREAGPVLAELRPRMRRARRYRQLQQATAATAAVAIIAVGVGLSMDRLSSPDDRIVTGPANSPSEVIESSSTTAAAAVGLPERSGEAVSTATVPADAATTPPLSPTVSESSAPDPTVDTTVEEGATTSGSAPTTTSSTPPTTAAPDEPTRIDSDCGAILVSVNGDEVELVEVITGSAGEPEIKSEGPEQIEVSFEDNGLHCELKAKVEAGRLVTTVENE